MLTKFRHFLVTIIFVISSIAGVVYGIFRPGRPENGSDVCRFFWTIIPKILGIRIEKRGIENFFKCHPCVITGNHQHSYDMFLYGHMLPVRNVSIGKKSIRRIPIFGWWFGLSGHIFIDRSNKSKAWQTIEKASEILHHKQTSVVIFPEGTRSKGKGLLPFKNGAFRLAIASKTAIQPLVISNYNNIDTNKWHAGKIIFEALEPIPTTGLSLDDVATLREKTRKLMQETLKKHDEELSASKADSSTLYNNETV